jgi:hypothetical protein
MILVYYATHKQEAELERQYQANLSMRDEVLQLQRQLADKTATTDAEIEALVTAVTMVSATTLSIRPIRCFYVVWWHSHLSSITVYKRVHIMRFLLHCSMYYLVHTACILNSPNGSLQRTLAQLVSE